MQDCSPMRCWVGSAAPSTFQQTSSGEEIALSCPWRRLPTSQSSLPEKVAAVSEQFSVSHKAGFNGRHLNAELPGGRTRVAQID